MASTYSNLKFQLMTTGENTSTWGIVTNINLGTAVEEAITGSASVVFPDEDDLTLTLTNSNASQAARNLRLMLSGATVGYTRTLTVPDTEKVYIIDNTCEDDVQVVNSTGSNVVVPAGKTTWVYSTGFGVVNVIDTLPALSVGGSDVVTEAATQTLTNKTLTAPTIDDGVLGSNTTATTQNTGDNSTKVATTAYVDAAAVTATFTGGNVANATTFEAAVTFSNTATVAGTLETGGAIDETVYNLTGTELDPSNGTVQYKTLSANTTLTSVIAEGESMTLMINDGSARTITWPSMVWVNNGGEAPELNTSGYTVVTLWNVDSVLYGALVGNGE